MKKLIYGVVLASLAFNCSFAMEKCPKKEIKKCGVKNSQKKAGKAQKEESKLYSLRFAAPYKSSDENYLIGASFFGSLEKNDKLIGLYLNPFVDFANFYSTNKLYGLSFCTLNFFKSINGVNCNLIFSVNSEANGIVLSGFTNISKKANGVSFAFLGNNHEIMNGLCLGLIANGGSYKSDDDDDISSMICIGEKLNGIAVTGLVNAYRNINGLAISLFANICENAVGVSCSTINMPGNFTGYEFGAANVNVNSDTVLQFGSYNLSGKTKNTAQFGFWNQINDENADNNMQFGLINKTKSDSFQIGLLNFSEKGFFKFFPFINF